MADLVLTGHVHDYQRFTRHLRRPARHLRRDRQLRVDHNLHQLAKDAKPGEEVADGVVFEYGDAKEYGFLRLDVADGKVDATYNGVHPGRCPTAPTRR